MRATTPKFDELRKELNEVTRYFRHIDGGNSTRYVVLSEALAVVGSIDAIRRYCVVTQVFLSRRIDREEDMIFEPIAGCLASGFRKIKLYEFTDCGHKLFTKWNIGKDNGQS